MKTLSAESGMACPRPDIGLRPRLLLAGLAAAAAWPAMAQAAANACSDISGEIAVDRPDVTNSSVVVPPRSLQIENGVNLSDQRSARTLDGTNTRLRLGLGSCNEVLLDLPDYTRRIGGAAASGFSDAAPALKHQFGPLPGDFELSATLGLGLPTGTTAVAEHGYQPYLQFPWSRELGGGWGLSGMFTTFWQPGDPERHLRFEPTFVVEREVARNADLFVEYVGEYADRGAAAQLLNSGGAWRITRLQQLDFHLALGLNQQAPRYVAGVGYSIRWDSLW